MGGKQTIAERERVPIAGGQQWVAAWDEYIRGNVISQTSAQYIKLVLVNTMARAEHDDEEEDDEDADPSDMDEEIPRLRLDAASARNILHKNFDAVHDSDDSGPGDQPQKNAGLGPGGCPEGTPASPRVATCQGKPGPIRGG